MSGIVDQNVDRNISIAESLMQLADCRDVCKIATAVGSRCAVMRSTWRASPSACFMAGKSAVRWKVAPRVPTRARYEAVLGGDVGQLSGV
jgi:hypothetical protein